MREGNIIDLRDATHAQMVRVFGSAKNPRGQLSDWVRSDRSRVYVYYSGHGAPGRADGTAYLVPSDADATRIELNGYELETLYRNLGKLKARSVSVVLEACFSGNTQGGSLMAKASPVFVQPKTATVPGNLTVISAGSADQIASWEEDQPMIGTWLENTDEAEAVLKRGKLSEAKRKAALLAMPMHKRRRWWAELIGWTAYTMRHATDGSGWEEYALVARELLGKRPLDEIGIMNEVAEATLVSLSGYGL